MTSDFDASLASEPTDGQQEPSPVDAAAYSNAVEEIEELRKSLSAALDSERELVSFSANLQARLFDLDTDRVNEKHSVASHIASVSFSRELALGKMARQIEELSERLYASEERSSQACLDQKYLLNVLEDTRHQLHRSEATRLKISRELKEARSIIEAIYESSSWKFSLPLRQARSALMRFNALLPGQPLGRLR